MKRILLFLIPWFLAAGCAKHLPYYYTIIGLQLHNADNSGAKPVDATTNDIPAKAYAIRLQYTDQLKDSTHDQDDESPYRTLNRVQGFTVTSLTDFDSLHPAGSSLNNYFLYNDRYWSPQVNSADSIQAHISMGSMGTGFGAGLGQKPPQTWTTDNYLVLMKPPASFGNRSFVIHVELTDNTRFTDTITVNLLP